MSGMSKRERVMAALQGREVDHPPVSFWGHDFLREWSAEGLAAAMLDSVRDFDYDYLKVNPRATYYSEAWGCRYMPSNHPARGPELEQWVVYEASDLEKIRPVDPAGGPFAEQIEALRLINDGLGGDVPFVQTVFSPLSVVGRLTDDREAVKAWMANDPDRLHTALTAVAETLAGYARASLNAGAGGIFFPTTEWGAYDALAADQYETFGRPYDLRVLDAAQGAPFNILHVCRPNNMLEALLDYPVAAFNWADRAPGNLALGQARERTDRAVMGGVEERALLNGSPEDVRHQVRDAIQQTKGSGLLIAPGCSISPRTPPENLRAAVEAARQ